jgi:hypothetical protein
VKGILGEGIDGSFTPVNSFTPCMTARDFWEMHFRKLCAVIQDVKELKFRKTAAEPKGLTVAKSRNFQFFHTFIDRAYRKSGTRA